MSSASHAGEMDAIYRVQRHFYDLTRKYYLLGRDRLIDRLSPPGGGKVLEIGCGTGRNLIVAARRWPDAVFFGIDISEEMLVTARSNIARAGLAHRISVAQGDATAFDPQALFGVPAFDRIFQSYTLSMIPQWQAALQEAARHLAGSGRLMVVDFGQQERLPRLWRKALYAWLGLFQVTPRARLADVAATVAGDRQLWFDPLYRGYAWSLEMAADERQLTEPVAVA